MERVDVIMRALPRDKWKGGKYTTKDIVICDCGYIELPEGKTPENTDIWDLCNWSCWSSDGRPEECNHLLIDHCNSDMAYKYKGQWYSHSDKLEGSLNTCVEHMKSQIYGDVYNALWPIQKSVKLMEVGA